MNTKIEIPLRKNKIAGITISSFVFVIAGIWLFINANDFQNHPLIFFRNPIVVKIMGIAGTLFFTATGIFGIKKLFDKKPGLIIDQNGITDNTSALSTGLIEWKDILEINTKQVMTTRFLLIKVKKPEKYLEKAKNGMKAKLMKSNMKIYGTPLSISYNTLKYDFKKLQDLIQTEFDKHKNVNQQ